mgnify:CR=1 FL=1|jgi:hypothetical protein
MSDIDIQIFNWIVNGRASDGTPMEYYLQHPNEAPSYLSQRDLDVIYGYYQPETEHSSLKDKKIKKG